jgi:hypothetical protein
MSQDAPSIAPLWGKCIRPAAFTMSATAVQSWIAERLGSFYGQLLPLLILQLNVPEVE